MWGVSIQPSSFQVYARVCQSPAHHLTGAAFRRYNVTGSGAPRPAKFAAEEGPFRHPPSRSPGTTEPTEKTMPLIQCSACGRQISTEADTCPQCGHPNRAAPRAAGQPCYSCSAAATTRSSKRVQAGRTPSRSIFVSHGRGGAYELRCDSCYSSAVTWKVVGWIFFAVVAIIILTMFVGIGRR